MKHGMLLVIPLVAALSLGACSSNPAPNGSIATAGSVGVPPQPRWSGSIRGVVEDRLNSSDSTRDRSYGSLVWTTGATPALSNAKLDFTYSGASRELTWGIFFGPCGNASLPVVTLSDFPELEMSNGGHVQITAPLSVELPTTGAFHVDIYKDRRGGPEWVVACGNLRFVRG